MEREEMERNHQREIKPPEPEFVLQWGKRLRCVRVKNPEFASKSTGGIRRKITSRIVSDTADPSFSPFNRLTRVSEGSGNGKSRSPEKGERYYPTRGSVVEETGKSNSGGEGEKGNLLWPKLYITLSSKEKEEDFLLMKGCKLPQRPKKRAKFIQRTLLLVSPGAWLSDMCQERYEVREKTPKKRPRGLKAMGAIDSDSE